MTFQPDYNNMLAVLNNQRPQRLPVYEHIICAQIMEKILGIQFADFELASGTELEQFFSQYCRFWKEMTYDTVSYEVCITEILPDHGAIMGGRRGPIQNRQDFEKYPWDELSTLYWEAARKRFDMLEKFMPPGMKAVGGVGNGVLEISEDLVGYQYLSYMQVDDPPLFADLYRRIGDLMVGIWQGFLQRYAGVFAICRFGDDLGFKTSTLVNPKTIRANILPAYKRVIDEVHRAGRPFLWHSCGNIFNIMEDVIGLGINAKHSNEDVIAPFDRWISLYGDRIGLLGGVDVDILCQQTPEAITQRVLEMGGRFRNQAKGYALGSGNSIPDYIPVDGYLAMIRGAQKIREMEQKI